MKTTSICYLLLALLCCAACSKDKDSVPVNSDFLTNYYIAGIYEDEGDAEDGELTKDRLFLIYFEKGEDGLIEARICNSSGFLQGWARYEKGRIILYNRYEDDAIFTTFHVQAGKEQADVIPVTGNQDLYLGRVKQVEIKKVPAAALFVGKTYKEENNMVYYKFDETSWDKQNIPDFPNQAINKPQLRNLSNVGWYGEDRTRREHFGVFIQGKMWVDIFFRNIDLQNGFDLVTLEAYD